jgi:leader peptidase (prepilin peptidase)/N-methyltransferase
MNEFLFLLQKSPVGLGTVLFVLGACIGSFLNLISLRLPLVLFHQWQQQCLEMLEQDRLPEHQDQETPPNLVKPGSRCPDCLTPLRIVHNIPIIGYLLLGGKCGFCKTSISIRYPTVEIVAAVMSVYLGMVFGIGWPLLFALVFAYTLIVLSLIDLDHKILPDIIVLPLLWTGLIANCFSVFTNLQSAVLGAVAGYLVLWSIYQVHRKISGKEGMGYGDFKFLAAIGAWLGWEMLPVVILLASISGTIISIGFIVIAKRGRDIPIPFGPYLAIAALVSMIWGSSILQNYLQLFNL